MHSPHKRSFAAEELKRRQQKKPWSWIAVGVVAAALIVSGYMLYRKSLSQKQAETETKQIKSIAILPFINISADPSLDFLCDGLAEDIINALTHLGNLRVPARTSSFAFKGKDMDIREIGDKLDVETVLEGSISKSGDRLRITVQLNDVASGYHLLSEPYNTEMADFFDIRDDITRKIVEKLRVDILADERSAIEKRSTVNMEAYTCYLQGRQYFHAQSRSLETIKQAMEFFRKAVAADPNYALAYTGLADVYFYGEYFGLGTRTECLRMAKEAAAKALELDDSLAEVHNSYAHIVLYYDWDWEAARLHFSRALEINPGFALAHWWYHDYLWVMGRADDALAEMQRAAELDPLAVYMYAMVGWNYALLGRYEESWEWLRKGLEVNPNSSELYARIAYYHEARSEYDKAIDARLKALSLRPHPGDPDTDGDLGRLYAKAGEKEKARRILAVLKEKGSDTWFDRAQILVALGERDQAMGVLTTVIAERAKKDLSFSNIALIFLQLGDIDRTFEWLNRAFEKREGGLYGITYIKLEPEFAPIRSDLRYTALLKKMGLPEN